MFFFLFLFGHTDTNIKLFHFITVLKESMVLTEAKPHMLSLTGNKWNSGKKTEIEKETEAINMKISHEYFTKFMLERRERRKNLRLSTLKSCMCAHLLNTCASYWVSWSEKKLFGFYDCHTTYIRHAFGLAFTDNKTEFNYVT